MSRYAGSYRGIGQMIRSDFMRVEMKRRADLVKEHAELNAPVDWAGPHPERYKNAFRSSSGTRGGFDHDRAYGRVTNIAPEAYFVEFGTKNNPRHRTLGRALSVNLIATPRLR